MIPRLGKRLLLVNTASGVLERLVSAFVLVWLYQYLVKRISPEEYSLYPILSALLVFVPPLLSVLTSGLARYIVEAAAQSDDRRVTQICSTMVPLHIAGALALTAIGGLLTAYVGVVLNIVPERISDA